MTDDDISLAEKRVYGDAGTATTIFVASETGLLRVSISDDIIGEFALERRGHVLDVAADDGRLAIATPEDVHVATKDGFRETGFGPATAVSHRDGLIAAGEGRVARYDGTWTTLSELRDVRAIGGRMVAAESGIHQLDGTHVGLEDASDVSTSATPLAATSSGLYYLANGWMRALEGSFSVVAGDEHRGHAATADSFHEQAEDGEWRTVELPVEEPVVGVAHGAGSYAVTESGTVLASIGDGWRHRSVGVTDATGLAVP
jgi:hypothetical protein